MCLANEDILKLAQKPVALDDSQQLPNPMESPKKILDMGDQKRKRLQNFKRPSIRDIKNFKRPSIRDTLEDSLGYTVYSADNCIEREEGIQENDDGKLLYTSFCWILNVILEKKKALFKWTFILMNFALELCQAIASQEAGDGKISGNLYRNLTVIFSSMCLILSFFELVYEAMRDGVKWQKRQGYYCFYYPGNGRIFGRFSLWFGLTSVTIQFILNVAALVIKRGVLKFDHLAVLLSLGRLIIALVGEHEAMEAVVRCSTHGCKLAQGKRVQGVWVFECSA